MGGRRGERGGKCGWEERGEGRKVWVGGEGSVCGRRGEESVSGSQFKKLSCE